PTIAAGAYRPWERLGIIRIVDFAGAEPGRVALAVTAARTAEDVPALDIRLKLHVPVPVIAVRLRLEIERERLVIILRIHHHGRAHLLDIGEALRLPRLLPRLGEDGEEDRGQDSDDRYHNEQLDQCKASRPAIGVHPDGSFPRCVMIFKSGL